MNDKTFTEKYLSDVEFIHGRDKIINEIYEFVNSKGSNEDFQIWILELLRLGVERRIEANHEALNAAVLSSMKHDLKIKQDKYSLVLHGHMKGEKEILKLEIEDLKSKIKMIEGEK